MYLPHGNLNSSIRIDSIMLIIQARICIFLEPVHSLCLSVIIATWNELIMDE
jgi:hypothetical protein